MAETIEKEDSISNGPGKRKMRGHYALILFNFLVIVFLFQKMHLREFDSHNQVRDAIQNLIVTNLRLDKQIAGLDNKTTTDYLLLEKEQKSLQSTVADLERLTRPHQAIDVVSKFIRDALSTVEKTNKSIENLKASHKLSIESGQTFSSTMDNVIPNLLQDPKYAFHVNDFIRLKEKVILYSFLQNKTSLQEMRQLIHRIEKLINDGEHEVASAKLRREIKVSVLAAADKIAKTDTLHTGIKVHLSKYNGQIYKIINSLFSKIFAQEDKDVNTIIILFYIVLLGSWIHVAYLIYEIMKRNGKIQRQAKELQEGLDQQKILNDMQRKFVSMVSHEFRTPLAIIDSGAQKLIRRADSLTPPKIQEVALKTRNHINKLIELLDSILHSQRLDAGAMEIMPGPCDLKLIIGDVCQLQYEIHTRNVIVLNISALPQTIIADSKLVGHVFTNLISNAVKYSPDGTEVSITGETFDDSIEIRIEDKGVGIPEEELSDLFSCFYRASTSVGISGTGIGLHLVKNIIDEHGGSIEVESEVGVGSSFTVRLPRTQPDYVQEEEKPIEKVA